MSVEIYNGFLVFEKNGIGYIEDQDSLFYKYYFDINPDLEANF